MRKLSRLLKGKSYEEAVKEDIVNVVSEIESEDTAYETKHNEKTCIKCFYCWLRGGGDGEEYPVEVKWIKNKRTLNHSILPNDLVTEDEVRPAGYSIIGIDFEYERVALKVWEVEFDRVREKWVLRREEADVSHGS
ncbi:MAG: hypothetical protein ACRECH_01610 [Nitrososphaerales archaeon]